MRISDKTKRRLEIAANIAILVVAIIVVRNLIWPKSPKQQVEGPTVGSTMSLPGIKWDERATLVLVLQKGCRYCEESSDFYRRLHDERTGSKPRMIAAVPGDKADIANYLSLHGVVVDEIVNPSLSEINVALTPTLLLVDRSGKVSDVWVGKLDKLKEAEVTQRLLASK